jgi:hypothetical protein
MDIWESAMGKFMNVSKRLLISLGAVSFALSCAKQETTVRKVTPNTELPSGVDTTPPTQNPGSGERLATDPICTIPLLFPNSQSGDENEAMLGDLIEQPSWIPEASRIPAPDQIEPPTMMCLFVDNTGAKPTASIRIEYEDRYGRVQYTLKHHTEPNYAAQANANTAPPPKVDNEGNTVIYVPSYFVNLDEDNFELFFMPTWGFITIKGKKEADGFLHAKIKYIKFLTAPPAQYYLTYHINSTTPNTAAIAKIQHCTGEDGQNSQAKIVHPDRQAQPPVECARAHGFIRSVYRGPYDQSLGIFKSHNEYTGNPYNYRIEMVRQYTDERPEALADFQTVLGRLPKTLGTIKFRADQVWAGVAP